jgi:SAM-dependent methyltransferase
MRAVKSLRKYWLRWNVDRAAGGDPAAMDRLYMFGDPWKLDSPGEHFRFQETARIIREKIGQRFGSILEIGCGEGLQTAYLAPLADRIVGLDPSAHAIKRANARHIPNAAFAVGDLDSYATKPDTRFDLVTACEVLYYMKDFEHACENLNKVARTCLVTYFKGAYERLDPCFAGKNFRSEIIKNAECEWKAVFWTQS